MAIRHAVVREKIRERKKKTSLISGSHRARVEIEPTAVVIVYYTHFPIVMGKFLYKPVLCHQTPLAVERIVPEVRVPFTSNL